MAYNSTIISKKRKLSCGCFDYAFSKNKCRHHATIDSTNKRIAEYEQEEDADSWTNLRDDLDIVFSRYIRTKYANEDGMVQCYTSGKWMTIGEAQCGHYIGRTSLATRWHEDNCRPQSDGDNEYLYGNLEVFRKNIEAEKPGLPDELLQLSREVSKPTISELKELLIVYRSKLKIAQLKLKK